MLEILIDKIFVMISVFQQTVGIPMVQKVLLFLPTCSFYSYEADFIQGPLKKNEKKLV
jgi:putative component of membrane protein insertase Oxa1/YidC/SpoIIIJ protein YidD